MKKHFVIFIAMLVLIGITLNAKATTIDFESTALGNYTSLTIGDVTFTTSLSGGFDVVSESPGPPLSGNMLLPLDLSYPSYYMKAAFSVGSIFDVSVDVGDYNADVDYAYLEAYDINDNLIGQDSYVNPAALYGGDTMSVSTSTAISYVLFYDTDPYATAVFWDNFTYDANPVPLPGAVWLLGSGLLGLIGWRRKKMMK